MNGKDLFDRFPLLLIPAQPKEPNRILFPFELSINSEAPLALVALHVLDNSIGTRSTKLLTER
jgi:hypothetical protein